MKDILPWAESSKETLDTRIMRHEGFCNFPKPDAKGKYAIGFGHDISKDECADYPHGITWDEAEALLESDLALVKENCAKAFPWLSALSAVRQEVIWEMAFQMGVNGVAAFHGMITAIKAGDWNGASEHMLASLWHKETSARCEELADIMLKGYTKDNPTA